VLRVPYLSCPNVLVHRWRKCEVVPDYYSVKEAVFPFNKFPAVDPILGPEMKSTGEVMGVGDTFAEAYGKAQAGAGDRIWVLNWWQPAVLPVFLRMQVSKCSLLKRLPRVALISSI